MAVDSFIDLLDDSGQLWISTWRCLNCGQVVDPVTVKNVRRISTTVVTADGLSPNTGGTQTEADMHRRDAIEQALSGERLGHDSATGRIGADQLGAKDSSACITGTKAPQQFFADSRWDRLLRQATQGGDGLLDLFEIDPAAKAHAQVPVKPEASPERHRPLEIVRHHLDEFLAGHSAGQVVEDVSLYFLSGHAGFAPPARYFSSVLRTRDRARWSRTR